MESQTQAPPPQAPPSDMGVNFRAWFEVNKKRIGIIGVSAAGLILVTVLFIQHQAGKETAASKALSDIRIPFNPALLAEPGTADKLYKVATEYQGTKAAASALQMSAGILYTEKDFPKAQDRFNSVIQQYPECAWVSDAHLGVAACLEAQGKTDEAIKKFEDIRKRYATMPIIDDAKLSLARLYEKSNPTESFKLYEDLVKNNPNSGKAAEAGMRQEELLKQHPDLAKLREPIVPPTPPQPPVQITQMTNRPTPGTNRSISLTNLIPRKITNGAGSQIQVIPSPSPAGAPPPTVTAPAPTPAPAPAPQPPK